MSGSVVGTPPIRLLLVDDHPLVRDGLHVRLSEVAGFVVVGEAASGHEALALAATLQPDLVLVDIGLPDISGVELTTLFNQRYPAIRVLILSMYDNREYVRSTLLAGARGYVLKDAPASEIVAAIHAVAAGGVCYGTAIATALLDGTGAPPLLSAREREVLILLAEGGSNKQVARQLGVSVRTVETHRLNLRRKLGIATPAGLTAYALKQGWIKV